jgi:acyl-CoA synthetase (AMP-forming)/AMP-acid ligase II
MNLLTALAEAVSNGSGHGLHLFDGDRETEHTSYDELFFDAGCLACGLLARGVTAGERLAIALPTSLDFARAFLGVLAAGAVPVPVPPPLRFAPANVRFQRIALILRQSKVRFILSAGTLGKLLTAKLADLGGDFTVMDVRAIPDSSPSYANTTERDPALVQYTSGTVGDPKGVVLSHGNLLANVAAISQGLDLNSADVSCTWLPMFHDMGLIGTFLCPALNDAEAYLLPPEHFLLDPGRWVRMIDRYRGTVTAAPSSGYLHTVRKVPAQEVGKLDLSGWRLALNGAENVDITVMRRFSEHFAPAGFRHTAFLPVYGLAEAGLAVAFPPIHRPPKTMWVRRDLLGEGKVAFSSPGAERGREIASVGMAVKGAQIRLVDDERMPFEAEARIGEIQVRGASVMRGYEAHDEATCGAITDDRWVVTGDLGFWHVGELHIVGRKKEMIIVGGQNHYASDIESVVGQVPGVSPQAALAASVSTDDGEVLVLFIETSVTDETARSALADQARYAVSSALGISPREIFLVPRGRLRRTSSGKLQRHQAEVNEMNGNGMVAEIPRAGSRASAQRGLGKGNA